MSRTDSEPSTASRRPVIHFTAPDNWMNDPNGLIQWGDEYHLFYQHNPHAPAWARPYWGHAASTDLLTWADRPIALTPDGPWDAAGCYSGCCIDDGGVPTIIYTGVSMDPGTGMLTERVLSATSVDGLQTWVKNVVPLIDAPPPDLDVTGFRDPFVWHDADGSWRLIIGCGDRERGGMVLLYASDDLTSWRYLGVLLEQSDVDDSGLLSATVWECPQLIRLPEGDILIVSVLAEQPSHVVMIDGQLTGDRFHPRSTTRMDDGSLFYAPHVFRTHDDRWIAMAWLRDPDDHRPEGWAGSLSLPREIRSGASTPRQSLSREVAALRGVRRDALHHLTPGSPVLVADGGAIELRLRCELRGTDEVRISWPGGRSRVTATATARRSSGQVDVRMIVDRSIVEIFLDGTRVETLPRQVDLAGGAIELNANRSLSVLCSWWPLAPSMRR